MANFKDVGNKLGVPQPNLNTIIESNKKFEEERQATIQEQMQRKQAMETQTRAQQFVEQKINEARHIIETATNQKLESLAKVNEQNIIAFDETTRHQQAGKKHSEQEQTDQQLHELQMLHEILQKDEVSEAIRKADAEKFKDEVEGFLKENEENPWHGKSAAVFDGDPRKSAYEELAEDDPNFDVNSNPANLDQENVNRELYGDTDEKNKNNNSFGFDPEKSNNDNKFDQNPFEADDKLKAGESAFTKDEESSIDKNNDGPSSTPRFTPPGGGRPGG